MITLDDKITFDLFEENGEYDVIRTYARVDRTPLQSSYIETIVYGIELKRKCSYYLMNVVLPVIFMQLLGVVVFVVPTESGEKLTFSLTLLLSLTVMMTLVAEKIPTTSLQIPTLSIYMLGGAVISILEVIMTVVILYFKHYHREDVHFAKRIQSIANILGMFKCKKRNKIESKKEVMKLAKHNGITTIADLESKDQVIDEKNGIPTEEREHFDENDLLFACKYTSGEISEIINKFCLVFFTVVTLGFTLTMFMLII